MTTSDLKILDGVGHHSSSSMCWTKDMVDRQILKPRMYQQANELGKAMPRGCKKVNTRPHQESVSPPKEKKVSGKPKTLGLKCKRMFQVWKRRKTQNKSHGGTTEVSGKDWQ